MSVKLSTNIGFKYIELKSGRGGYKISLDSSVITATEINVVSFFRPRSKKSPNFTKNIQPESPIRTTDPEKEWSSTSLAGTDFRRP